MRIASIETLEFSLCVKNKILRIKDITKLNIEYVSGKNIIFKNTNLGLIEPHKIIISNNSSGIVLLCYNEDTTLYKGDLSTITMNELRDIIKVLLEKIKKIFKIYFFNSFGDKLTLLGSIYLISNLSMVSLP